jgi:hypothetical protein
MSINFQYFLIYRDSHNRVQRIQGNEFNGSIKTGDVVTVSIDPRKPKRFLIQEIYKKI